MSMGLAAAMRRATGRTRAGRLIRRAFGRPPLPETVAIGIPPLQEAAVLFTPDPAGAAAAVETFAEAAIAGLPAADTPLEVASALAPEVPSAVAASAEPLQAKAPKVIPLAPVAKPVPTAMSFPLAAFPALRVASLAAPHGRLDDVIRRLSGRPRPDTPVPTIALPEGAQFLARRYEAQEGARDYRLYVPAALDGPPRGLILMLHGCTQTPEDFAVGTGMNALAERERLILAYPEQRQTHNGNRCWNWFRPEDQRRGDGEPAVLAGMTQALVAEFSVPHDRVFVAGLSAGGAMAAVLGETYPDLIDAVGVHSGVACGSARDARSALAAMRGLVTAGIPGGVEGPRTIIFHGDADRTVHPSNAARLVVRAVGEGASGHWNTHTEGGRAVTRSVTRNGPDGRTVELWMVEGAGHAWSGGNPAGSYAEAEGPDASAEMVRFFLSKEPGQTPGNGPA